MGYYMKKRNIDIKKHYKNKTKSFSLAIVGFSIIFYLSNFISRLLVEIDIFYVIIFISVLLLSIMSLILVIKNKFKLGISIQLFAIIFSMMIVSYIRLSQNEYSITEVSMSIAFLALSLMSIGFIAGRVLLIIFALIGCFHFLFMALYFSFIPFSHSLALCVMVLLLMLYIYHSSKLQQFILKFGISESEKQAKSMEKLTETNELLNKSLRELSDVNIKLNNMISEKDLLIKELHHRVKNNLQTIISILSLQQNYITDAEINVLFDESQKRIKSIALVHEQIHKSEDLNNICFYDYVKSLVDFLFRSYSVNTVDLISKDINLVMNINKDIMLSIDSSVPMGLLLNELITNVIKHAFKDNQYDSRLIINMNYSKSTKVYELTVKDNGCGMDGNINIENEESLGFLLINSLVEQLRASLKLDTGDDGTAFKITIPERENRSRIGAV